MSEEKKGFVVKDRRAFAGESQEIESQEIESQESGVRSQEAKEEPSREEAKEEPSREEAKEETPEDSALPGEQEAEPQLPEVNFSTFIISLSASALVNLGVTEDPVTERKIKNLPLGKQTIDILGMLEKKTHGNLTMEEERLLKNILYDLRITYVKQKE